MSHHFLSSPSNIMVAFPPGKKIMLNQDLLFKTHVAHKSRFKNPNMFLTDANHEFKILKAEKN